MEQNIDKLLRALRPERPIPKCAESALAYISHHSQKPNTDEMVDLVAMDIDSCYWDDAYQDAQKLSQAVTD